MHGKAINTKEAQRILSNNGYSLDRTHGGHLIYKNDKGNIIVITCNKLSQKTWKRVCKERNLICT